MGNLKRVARSACAILSRKGTPIMKRFACVLSAVILAAGCAHPAKSKRGLASLSDDQYVTRMDGLGFKDMTREDWLSIKNDLLDRDEVDYHPGYLTCRQENEPKER